MGDTTNLIVNASVQRFFSGLKWVYAPANLPQKDWSGAVTVKTTENQIVNGKTQKVEVVGPAIDCSHFVMESMLGAGYNVKQTTSSQMVSIANGTGTSSYYSAVSTDQIQSGNVIVFQGHVGIVTSYDPVTGIGTYNGAQSQNSGVLQNVLFTTKPNAQPGSISYTKPETGEQVSGYLYWGTTKSAADGKAFVGATQVKSGAYDPNSAKDKLNAINGAINDGLDKAGREAYFGSQETDSTLTYSKGIYGGGCDTCDEGWDVDGTDGATAWTQTITYADDSASVSIGDEDGNVTTTNYSASGNVTSTSTLTTNPADNFTTETVSYSGGATIRTLRDDDGNLISTTSITETTGGGTIETVTYPNGSVVKYTYDANHNPVNTQNVVTGGQTIGQFIGTTLDALSFIKALQSGQALPTAVSGFRLASDITGSTVLSGTASVGGALLSLQSLFAAIERGDMAAAAAATGNTLNFAVSAYTSSLAAQHYDAIAAIGASDGNAAAFQFASDLGEVVSFVNIANCLAHNDYAGAAVYTAAWCYSNPYIAAAYTIYSMIAGEGNGPRPWGEAHFVWNADGSVGISASGHDGGDESVHSALTGVQNALQVLIADFQSKSPEVQLGLIANRLPSLILDFKTFALNNIDPVTGADRTLHYDELGVLLNSPGMPMDLPLDSPEYSRSLGAQALYDAVLRSAIAPLWEVATARLQAQAGDPQAGLTEVQRAQRNGQLAAAVPAGATTQNWRPIVLDLNGDGIATTDQEHGVAFDVDSSGYLKKTAWINKNDAFLVLDRNVNGAIDDGGELFSNSKVADSAKGVASMRWVDANGDGDITAYDPVFSQIKVWQDANGNGGLDAGELKTLSEMGITALHYGRGSYDIGGVTASQRTSGYAHEWRIAA